MAYLLHVSALFSFIVYESCAKMPQDGALQNATLRISLAEGGIKTKGSSLVGLDTNNFILKVYSQSGDKVYDGKYGARPESFSIPEGAYYIGILSKEFSSAEFNESIVGTKSDIVVNGGEDVSVSLVCSQINCGVRISCTSDFVDHFSARGIFVGNGSVSPVVDFGGASEYSFEKGLYYSFSNDDFGYFMPGTLEFYLRRESVRVGYENEPAGSDSLLFSRCVDAGQMISFNFDWSEGSSRPSFSVAVDTSRAWSYETYNPGCLIPADALTIEEAKSRVGESGIKVFGYILGGDVTANSFRVSPPFTLKSNLLLAPSIGERNRNNCMAVELPSSSNAREDLNLVAHPNLLGKAVVLTAKVVDKYLGYYGLKSVKSYSILF